MYIGKDQGVAYTLDKKKLDTEGGRLWAPRVLLKALGPLRLRLKAKGKRLKSEVGDQESEFRRRKVSKREG
ncbi:MAG: hypothetical protein JRD93_04075 [Deltaproteobacteria bacterium]|nr:hypothetical protein [Deltaproteobacteria bacterium]